jgi:hypothetical protein
MESAIETLDVVVDAFGEDGKERWNRNKFARGL